MPKYIYTNVSALNGAFLKLNIQPSFITELQLKKIQNENTTHAHTLYLEMPRKKQHKITLCSFI